MLIIFNEGVKQHQVKEVLLDLNVYRHHSVDIRGSLHVMIDSAVNLIKTDKLSKIKRQKCVRKVVDENIDYHLADASAVDGGRSVVNISGYTIGSNDAFNIIAGPCAVESSEQIYNIANKLANTGVKLLRGGTYKARTSPYKFQGLGFEGLQFLSGAAKQNKMLCVTEVLDTKDVDNVANYVDIIQIGARNMCNYALIKAVAQIGKPIILKRGFSATYHDLLLAAEYVLLHGGKDLILCERGIKTFENYTRNTLDISAVPVLQQLSHLPVIVDPSHGTGIRSLVSPLTKAALVAGSHGAMIEVHTDPDLALSDANQTIDVQTFTQLREDLVNIGRAIDKVMC